MKLETTKSFVLVVLIGMSLLLTFGLWTHQPSEGDASLTGEGNYTEGNLGGTEESLKTIVEPSSIIFHDNGSHYGFPNPANQRNFYGEIQEWSMSNFQVPQILSDQSDADMEINFPDALPMSIVGRLFNLSESVENPPTWSFDRMTFDYEEENNLLRVTFDSVDRQRQARATIHDSNSLGLFQTTVEDKEGLIPYILFAEGSEEIYVPSQTSGLHNYTLSIIDINPQMLVNSLFRDPEVVSRSLSPYGTVYTDYVRELRIRQNGQVADFINPISNDGIPPQKLDLLDLSMSNISSHGGWNNDYKLFSINRREERVRYQMYYQDFPVFDSGLTMIEQEFGNQTLLSYQRPMFRINSVIDDPEVKDLASGEEIIAYLRNNDGEGYSIDNIEDIRIGYDLTYNDNASTDFLGLKAKWFMKHNGSWRAIKEENMDAMESN